MLVIEVFQDDSLTINMATFCRPSLSGETFVDKFHTFFKG